MRRWLLPALTAMVLAAAGGVLATSATAGDHRDHHHGDKWSHHGWTNGTTTNDTTSGSTTGSTTTTSETPVCGLDAEWLMTSLKGDLFEIRGGRLALQKSQNAVVRQLAQKLISDHTQSYEEGAALARKLGIDVPTSPTPSEQWELEELAELSPPTFEQDYTELEVKDHVQDIQETQDEARMGCNEEVKDDAANEIPMLKEHLKLSVEAHRAVGSDDQGTTTTTSGSNG